MMSLQPESPVGKRRNIGVLLTMPRFGGGSYQWTVNILHVLADYAALTSSNIHIFTFSGYGERMEIETDFPQFKFHQISNADRCLMAVLRKAASALPALIPAIRRVFSLNSILLREGVDLVIFPTTMLDSALCKIRHIFFLADIGHIFHPEFFTKDECRRRNVLFRHGLQAAGTVVVETNQLKEDIIKHYGVNAGKIRVLHQTLSKSLESLSAPGMDDEQIRFRKELPAKYIFYPAQLWSHKNHSNLLRAVGMVKREVPDLQLILCGARKAGDDTVFGLIKDLGLEDSVRCLGYVPDRLMPVLYRNARALVLPTYLGPTNIPTLEAFFYGCPAIISDLPGVREQTGDAALFFDPDSPEEIAERISLVLRDESIREGMINKGYERSKLLSYENYRRTLLGIIGKAEFA